MERIVPQTADIIELGAVSQATQGDMGTEIEPFALQPAVALSDD